MINVSSALSDRGSIWPIPICGPAAAAKFQHSIERFVSDGGPFASMSAGPKSHLFCEAVYDLVTSEPAVQTAAALLESQNVALWSSGLFRSTSESVISTQWHQDGLNYPMSDASAAEGRTPSMVRLWIALTPCNADVGSMEVALDSHRFGFLPHEMNLSTLSATGVQATVNTTTFDTRIVSLSPGLAEAHTLCTVHRSHVGSQPGYRLNVVADYINEVAQPSVDSDRMLVLSGTGFHASFLPDPTPVFESPTPANTDRCMAVGQRRVSSIMHKLRMDVADGHVRVVGA